MGRLFPDEVLVSWGGRDAQTGGLKMFKEKDRTNFMKAFYDQLHLNRVVLVAASMGGVPRDNRVPPTHPSPP